MSNSSSLRSRKDLSCTADAQRFQKAFGLDLKRRVVENGEPFAIVQADTPHEIFHVMDIPIVTNQWWSAYISAKRLSERYVNVLAEHGFPQDSCKYCSLGLGCTLDNDPATAPWGGLPKPTVLVARMTCDCIQQVFSLWADALGAPFYPLEAPGWTEKVPNWWELAAEDWETVYQSDRLDLMVEEMKGLISLLERQTGRRFDENKLLALMHRINEQESTLGEAARLAVETVPCPVTIVDQMPNTMIPQWHRGSDWAVDHVKRFRDEIRERVDQGLAACANERVRMMWIGAGLWHDSSFYQALEDRFGAVFVWSMYLPFANYAYPRYKLDDPLRALASRIAGMNEVLHLPPWMNEWMVHEAKRAKIDAVMMLMPEGARLSQSGSLFTKKAFEDAGIPVIDLWADMVDSSDWDHDRMVSYVGEFLDKNF
ncbi:2-hydroxyacyl-CoA dehydratase subunit D [Gilvimarinus sp. F26214L]|uniref:2-hydroxyacyl-CoA dehydratase subunit D n=1 Tax=Gilvimarinus sp. DZF01 TaxID=3461371 RepID=UPI0040453392